ncbi:glutathione S-transferase [Dissophora ornata]|nr:hypothetical protein BGZ58_006781 [Dissophora ornata]KAI8601741.1 glutathione S-transferase [Dissophora ornata]
MIPTPTKNLSTEAMSRLSQAKDNEYAMLYYPFNGVVTALRAMLAMHAEKYTFIHPEDWPSQRTDSPFGHMPILYETTATGETLELAELSVIEFYLGKKFGLVGSNDWEEQLVRSYTNSTQTLFDKFVVNVVRAPKELQGQLMQLFVEKQVPDWAEFHERHLKANGSNGHYVGDKLTVADIKLATVVDNMIVVTRDKYISREKTPAIMAVHDNVEQHPKYAAWKASDEWKAYAEETKRRFNFNK